MSTLEWVGQRCASGTDMEKKGYGCEVHDTWAHIVVANTFRVTSGASLYPSY